MTVHTTRAERLVTSAAGVCALILTAAFACPGQRTESEGPPPGLSFPASSSPPSSDEASTDVTSSFRADMLATYDQVPPPLLFLVGKVEWSASGLVVANTSIASATAPEAARAQAICTIVGTWAATKTYRSWQGTEVRAANGDRLAGQDSPTDTC